MAIWCINNCGIAAGMTMSIEEHALASLCPQPDHSSEWTNVAKMSLGFAKQLLKLHRIKKRCGKDAEIFH